MKIRNIGRLAAFTGIVAMAACGASLPPQDLINARTAYDRADKGPAHELNPADLHVAKEQLNAAETSFTNDGDTQGTRDQAYLAVRKAELADVVAHTMQSNQSKEGVVNAMHADEKQTVAKTSVELG